MAHNTNREEGLRRKVDGWASPLARWTNGVTLFLTVTGLTIFLLPFGPFNQGAVLVHTLVGLLFTLPISWYALRHVRDYWDYPMTHVKFTGYAAGAAVLVCLVSGLVLTGEGALGTRITYLWRTLHNVSTWALILFLGPHLVFLWVRDRRSAGEALAGGLAAAMRGHGLLSTGSAAALLVATALVGAAIRPAAFQNEFPQGYDLTPYGDSGPFAPSLATTVSGGAYDAASLSGSASCGKAGCHQEIYEQWLPSAHRYASMDAGFQAIQNVMAQQNGPVTTRYCGGCHDPISLFSGTKNIGVDDLTGLAGYQEGISCLSCHAIQQTDVQGNANYVMHQPERYAFEGAQGSLAGFLSDFLIRTYPDQHVESLSRRMFKAPEFCAACHKQFIDEEINKVGWVQLQNQYDNWRASRWNHPDEPEKTLECRECHMPLVASTDPAAGDAADFNRDPGDGMHRSHRFLGANQFMPVFHELEGGAEHVELVERWLQGRTEVPEIADRWTEGPAVAIELDVPREVRPGDKVPLRVHITNNKVGHDFPTGPLDIIQAWVEIVVTDDAGHVVFHTGTSDENNFIEPGTYMFKAEPVDRYGNLIDRHNLWEMVGVRFKRSLFPGSAEVASFDFDCPGAATEAPGDVAGLGDVDLSIPVDALGTLRVEARLKYRKFDQYLLNFVFGEDAGLESPITVLSSAEARIRVLPSS